MKTFILVFVIVVLGCASVFADNPRWKIADETPIPPHPDLDVRWDVSGDTIPANIRVYRLTPNAFSPGVISNVMTLCGFTPNDKSGVDANGVVFQNVDGSRKLSISFADGGIHYDMPEQGSGPANITKDVPAMDRLPELATNFVRQIGIPISEVTGYFQTDRFNFSEAGTEYYTSNRSVMDIRSRTVKFRRCVDGIPVVASDGGSFSVGASGHVIQIAVDWHKLQPSEAYPALSPKTVMDFVRQGKAFQGLLPMSIGAVDWPAVKKMTITKALPCYFAGNSDRLYPFLVLFTTLETAGGIIDVQIECPVIDETKAP